MLKWIKSFFNKTSSIEYDNITDLLIERTTTNVSIPVERIISTYDKNKKTVLLIDDSPLILGLVSEYLEAIDITEQDYNIFKFYGLYAGFVMEDTLKVLKELGLEKVDYAILDIVLPGKLHRNGTYKKMDGVDISIMLNKEFRCKNFMFFSGNIINIYHDFVDMLCIKYRGHFCSELQDKIIIKASGDSSIIERLAVLFGE